MRNPKWHRDEIILALDLYFDPQRGSVDASNPKIIQTSKLLNELPLFSNKPDAKRFRNPNGVNLKLSNFLALDPTYKGKGMEGGSKLDAIVFKEFYDDREKLKRIANEIRAVAANEKVKKEISLVEEDEAKYDNILEGEILYKLHKVRERENKIVQAKKQQHYNLHGILDCESCKFEFEPFYGSIGKNFIECHHKMPLFTLQSQAKTTLDDLALVCPNCHRMLHRSKTYLSIEDLRSIVINHKSI